MHRTTIADLGEHLRIAYIHQDKKISTGAAQANDLMCRMLESRGIDVRHFYPRTDLMDAPHRLRGLQNILFFHSLLEHKRQILRYDIIQGTTYTPLALLPFNIPVVSHFGSTSSGFLSAVPLTHTLTPDMQAVWAELRKAGVINELSLRTRRPLRDVAEIEHFVAARADAVVATSDIVANELRRGGIAPTTLHKIHNSIEDYWFTKRSRWSHTPHLLYLGRLGGDVFTLKLKGFDRLLTTFRTLPKVSKLTFGMTPNERFGPWYQNAVPHHTFHGNLKKEEVARRLHYYRGSILLIPSRYEGFSLSLAEGMASGLVPVVFPVGVAPEIIRNGENGYIVKNVASMIRVSRMLLRDAQRRRRIANAAARTARQFRSGPITDQFVRLYQQLLAKRDQHEKQVGFAATQ